MSNNCEHFVRCYELIVDTSIVLRTWLRFGRFVDDIECNSGWKIETFGEIHEEPRTSDSISYFQTKQFIDDNLNLLRYVSEDNDRLYKIERRGREVIFIDNEKVISNLDLDNFMYVLENNNFSAISGILHLMNSTGINPSRVRCLPQGGAEILPNEIVKVSEGEWRLAELALKTDEQGFLTGASVAGSSFKVRSSHKPFPDSGEKLIRRSESQTANFYRVRHKHEVLSTRFGEIHATWAEDPSAPAQCNHAAMLIGGTGRYSRDGVTLSGIDIGYGRFLDGLALFGIPTLRYDRLTSLGARSLLTHREICDQASDVMDCLVDRGVTSIALMGHSYGSVVAAKLAADHSAVSLLVLISAPTLKLRDSIKWQRENALRKITDPELKRIYIEKAELFDRKLNGIDSKEISDKAENSTIAFVQSVGDQRIQDYVDRIDVPVVIVHGENDEQVSIDEAYKAKNIFETIKKDVEIYTFPELGHFLRYPKDVSTASAKNIKFDRRLSEIIRGKLSI